MHMHSRHSSSVSGQLRGCNVNNPDDNCVIELGGAIVHMWQEGYRGASYGMEFRGGKVRVSFLPRALPYERRSAVC